MYCRTNQYNRVKSSKWFVIVYMNGIVGPKHSSPKLTKTVQKPSCEQETALSRKVSVYNLGLRNHLTHHSISSRPHHWVTSNSAVNFEISARTETLLRMNGAGLTGDLVTGDETWSLLRRSHFHGDFDNGIVGLGPGWDSKCHFVKKDGGSESAHGTFFSTSWNLLQQPISSWTLDNNLTCQIHWPAPNPVSGQKRKMRSRKRMFHANVLLLQARVLLMHCGYLANMAQIITQNRTMSQICSRL